MRSHLRDSIDTRVSRASHPGQLSSSAFAKIAIGAQAIGAIALGAVAIGALAVGAVAIGRLAIGRARIRHVEIDELVVRKLRVIDEMKVPCAPASDHDA